MPASIVRKGRLDNATPTEYAQLTQSGSEVRGFAHSAALDLSGAAVTNSFILHPTRPCNLVTVRLVYTEASSADAGVTITVGKESDADYYYTGTSEASKDQWYEATLTPLQRTIVVGDTLICGSAGGKVGTGEIVVCAEYKVL